ncbi:MAG: sterol desaturase family protein [Candidatus Hydrogenedentales bacterium]|jgi:sterol desaturase/sphingolipid hydroxylase (fatty acid hydroxylase superfamily)
MVNLFQYAAPVFILCILIEVAFNAIARKPFYRLNDSLNNLSMSIADQIVAAFLKSAVFAGYMYLYEYHRLTAIPMESVAAWIACFLLVDMQYYWAHRASHEVSFLWGSHVPHHQSEEFNLSVALRQGAFQGAFFWVFYLPIALLGFPPVMFLICLQSDVIYQFFIHTRAIGKLGPLEWFMNTPSHHRVHHGKNPKYIDKNHAGVLIIWDRMFGSFVEEEEEPLYGTATPLRSWNPVWGQIEYWVDLCKLVAQVPSWRDKALLFLMPPAWRPAGFEKKGPPAHTTQAFYERYDAKASPPLTAYALAHFVPLVLGAVAFLSLESDLSLGTKAFVCLAFAWSLLSIGGIMEARRWSYWLEMSRLVGAVLGLLLLSVLGLISPILAVALGALIAGSLAFLKAHRTGLNRAPGGLPICQDTVRLVERARRPEMPEANDQFQATPTATPANMPVYK